MARFLAATAAMTTSSCRPPSGGPWPLELLYRSRGRSWAVISGSGALRGAGLYLPELGADPIPRGRRARLRPLLRSRSCRRMPGLASLSGRGRFRFPCQCLAARKGLPRRGARPLFLAPQCPSPPFLPMSRLPLTEPLPCARHFTHLLPLCPRDSPGGRGSSPTFSGAHTGVHVSSGHAALGCTLPWPLLLPLQGDGTRVVGEAGRGPARERPGSWQEVSLLPRGPRTVGAGGSPGCLGGRGGRDVAWWQPHHILPRV